MEIVEPIVGRWYHSEVEDTDFEVIGVEPDEDCVQIQYEDGTIEEVDMDTWYRLELLPTHASKDWANQFGLNAEEAGYSDPSMYQPHAASILRDLDFEG